MLCYSLSLSHHEVLAGQIMHRLRLTWLGNEGHNIAQTAGTFRILLFITVNTLISILLIILSTTMQPMNPMMVQWAELVKPIMLQHV